MSDVLRDTDGGEHVHPSPDQPLPGSAAARLSCTTRVNPPAALADETTPARGGTAHPARRVVVPSGHEPL